METSIHRPGGTVYFGYICTHKVHVSIPVDGLTLGPL